MCVIDRTFRVAKGVKVCKVSELLDVAGPSRQVNTGTHTDTHIKTHTHTHTTHRLVVFGKVNGGVL